MRLLYKTHRFCVSIVATDESDWNERRNDPMSRFFLFSSIYNRSNSILKQDGSFFLGDGAVSAAIL